MALFSYRLTLREESALMATQGEGYRRYLAAVPRMFSSLWPRLPAGGMEPQWAQASSGELFIFVFYVATGNMQVLCRVRSGEPPSYW